MDRQTEKSKIDEILRNSKNVLITAHKQSDPDAFGSVLGFKYYVDKYFPDVHAEIVFTGVIDEIKSHYNFLAGVSDIVATEDITLLMDKYDT